MADKKKKNKSHEISNLEWGMAISILGIIDAIQIVLDLMGGLGVLLNRFVSFATGLAWTTYLYLRGVSLNTPKILSVLLTLFLEEVPALDAMPFWFLDGAVMMASVKAEKQLEKVAGVAVAAAAVAAAPETGGASLAVGEAAEGAVAAEEGVEAATAEENLAENASENPDDENEEPDEQEDDEEPEEAQEDSNRNDDNKKEDEPDKNEDSSSKTASQRRHSFLNRSGSRNSEETGGDTDNSLDLRGGSAAKQRAEKERRLGALQNITDLSLSYGERKKAKEDEENAFTE